MKTNYISNIQSRNLIHFCAGIISRIPRYLIFRYSDVIARFHGAKIGKSVTIWPSFAKKLNSQISIGSNVSINNNVNLTSIIYPLKIGNNVIIGDHVNLILSSHDIDSQEFEYIQPNKGLIIEDFVWICPHAIILPSVKRIGYGAVIGAGSVVTKDIEPMTVVAGNPAKRIRDRKNVHTNICIESLLGGDLITYIKSRYIK